MVTVVLRAWAEMVAVAFPVAQVVAEPAVAPVALRARAELAALAGRPEQIVRLATTEPLHRSRA